MLVDEGSLKKKKKVEKGVSDGTGVLWRYMDGEMVE